MIPFKIKTFIIDIMSKFGDLIEFLIFQYDYL